MSQPIGFLDSINPTHVCKLAKPIYGLKQSARAWYNELKSFLLSIGFINSISDSSLFILNNNGSLIYLLVYVDDIIVTSNSDTLLENFTVISAHFSLKDLGHLSHFLGIEVLPHP